jgi:PleD family two-component response regulator
MKILIAEDDPTSRIILVAIVSEWGYEPIPVEDGAQALSLLQTDDAPRLLLLDWEMPEINGLALCKKIREEETSNPPYIILLTGRSDAVLKEIAQRFNNSLRPYDLCGRYGGEEFLIILNSKKDHVHDLFERIRRAIADEPFIYEETVLNITISCGVTLYNPPTDVRNTTQILIDADTALYEAKNNGRNQTVFTSS